MPWMQRKAATRPERRKPQEEQACAHLGLGPQPRGRGRSNLSAKPQPVEACCGGRKSTVSTTACLGVSQNRQQGQQGSGGHTLWRVQGQALRSLPWTRFSAPSPRSPDSLQGPAGPPRLRSKPKAVLSLPGFGPVPGESGTQNGETAAHLPLPQCCDFIGVFAGRSAPSCCDGAREGEQGVSRRGPRSLCGARTCTTRLPTCLPTVAPLQACRHPGSERSSKGAQADGGPAAPLRLASTGNWGPRALIRSLVESANTGGAPPGTECFAHATSLFLRVLGCHPDFTAQEIGPQRSSSWSHESPMRPARGRRSHGGNYLQPCPGWDGPRKVPSRGSCAQGPRATLHLPACRVCSHQPGVQSGEGLGEGPGPRAAPGGPSSSPTRNGRCNLRPSVMPGPPGDAPVPCCRRRSARQLLVFCALCQPCSSDGRSDCPQSCLPHSLPGPSPVPAVQMLRSV